MLYKKCRSIIVGIFSILILTSVIGTGFTPAQAQVTRTALVMEASIDDLGWGALHHAGMLALEGQFGHEIAISEKQDPPQWETAARDYAERGYDYVVMGGPQFTDVTAKIAGDYPETIFLVTAAVPPIDAPYPSNMVGLDAKNEQSGYLAGVLATGMTKTNTVGIVAAHDFPNLVRMYEAFKLAVHTENPEIKILQVYIGSFNDVSKGYEAAKGQIDAGADIIFQDLDRAAFGVINGLNESPGLLHIGNTNDQVFLDEELTLTSALFNHTSIIVRGIEGINSGEIKGGEFYRWGIAEGVSGIAPYHELEDQVPAELKAKIDELKNQMIEETLVIPEIYDEDGYKDYLVPAEETMTEEEDVAMVEEEPEGGGCLIATAAFGSEMASQVQFLREIRDGTILQTESGSAFMTGFNQFYYSFSPTIADYERENPIFKEAVKLALTPILTSLILLQYADIDSESEMLGYGISIILLNIAMYIAAPAVLIIAVRKRISNKVITN